MWWYLSGGEKGFGKGANPVTSNPHQPLVNTPSGYAGGYHPKSLANLAIGRAKLIEKRKNGELTNPEGYSLTSRLKQSLTKPLRKPLPDAPAGDLLVYATLKAAIATKAIPFLETWNRNEGKVSDKTQLLGDILIEVVFRDINSGKASDNNPSGTPYPALPPG